MINKQSISVTFLLLLTLFLACGDNTVGPVSHDQNSGPTLDAETNQGLAGDGSTSDFNLDADTKEELTDDDEHQYQHRHAQEVTAELVWYSSSTGTVPFSHRFIYSYADGTLQLDQISYLAGCCPDDLIASIDVARGSIRISERPVWDGPIFSVLSHLEARIDIKDLPAREYEIRFDYSDSGESVTFWIDLVNAPSGQYCFAL